MTALPSKLRHEPILEVVAEILFRSVDQGKLALLPGIAHREFGNDFPNIESGVISPAPMVNLTVSPLKLIGDRKAIQISPNGVSLATIRPYPGWASFREQFARLIHFVADTKTFSEIERVSLKFSNLVEAALESDHFALTNAKISLGGKSLTSENSVIRVQFPEGNLIAIVTIVAQVTTTPNQYTNTLSGIVIDVDVIAQGPFPTINDALREIDKAHDYEKRVFFSLLSKEQLDRYEPQY